MPQIGWFELLLIVITAILIIGPKDFPVVLKTWQHGSWHKKLFSRNSENVDEVTNLESEDQEKIKRANENTNPSTSFISHYPS